MSSIKDSSSIGSSEGDIIETPSDGARDVLDLEKRTTVILKENGIDRELATWNGDDDPESPYNWPTHRKLTMAILISIGGLVSTLSASMMAPALAQIGTDLHIGDDAETQIALSIYFLGLALGPLAIAPISEMCGRKMVWVICHLWYILFNSLCPLNRSKSVMISGRFLSGLGASVSIALSGPCMADIYKAEERGKSFAIAMFAPYLGAAVGPILGGYISEGLGWRWLFWTISFFDGFIVILGAVFIHESYGPVLLNRRSKKLRAARDMKDRSTQSEQCHPDGILKLLINLARPIKLFVTRPIIPFLSLLISYNFGVYCIALATFATLWQERYHMSVSTSGLQYIAIAAGSTIATQVGGPITDRVYAYLKSKGGGAAAPEYRVPMMIPGAVVMPIGLFMYGWSAENRLLWLVPDIGVALVSGGVMLSSQALFAYLIDEFQDHSASANAAARVCTNVMGFAFPIFAPKMYETLGYGWGSSLLAFLYLAMGLPAPLILWKWGPMIRQIGRPAA